MRTKAVIFTGVNEVEIGEVDIPKPGPTEVLVRTIMTGISVGTDGWYIKGLYLGGQIRFPTIYGYQRVGIVEEIGSPESFFFADCFLSCSVPDFCRLSVDSELLFCCPCCC